ncbi:MAG: type II and III secretion system protein [Planctomycetota bacterium]
MAAAVTRLLVRIGTPFRRWAVSGLGIVVATLSLAVCGCRVSPESAQPRAQRPAASLPDTAMPVAPTPDEARRPVGARSREIARRQQRPERLGARTIEQDSVSRRPVQASFAGVPLTHVLEQVAAALDLQLLLDRGATDGIDVSVRFDALPLGELLAALERMFPITVDREGRLLRVRARRGEPLSLLVYPLPGGLINAQQRDSFASLEQLSFVSRTQRGDGEDAARAAPLTETEPPLAHLDRFLTELPQLVSWPEGSTWFLDRRRNVLFVRGTQQALDHVETCLDRITAPPVLVEIEARFVELSQGFGHELGVELGLAEPFPLDRDGARDLVSLGADSGTRTGIAGLIPGVPSGLNLSVVGVMSQPRLRAVLRALEETSSGEIISAPTVTSVNNSRATIAITTNLPYVESFQPVFDRTLVASEGLSAADANVALVAQINDSNFTGIVLNVTPSVGSDRSTVHLRIQPVIRDQVDAISIAQGALLEGGVDPNISRPIIETRYLDAQLAIHDGDTVVLGGWRTTVERQELYGVPLLQSIPLLGRLFQRRVQRQEERNLVVLVTARVITR